MTEPTNRAMTEQDARIAAEDGQRKLAYLLEATSTLFEEPLDFARRIRKLAQLLVPDLGDWCWIDLVDGGALHNVVSHHWNASRLAEAGARPPVALDGISGRVRAIRTGVAELVENAGADLELAILSITSALHLPLRDSERVIGVVTLGFAESNRRHRADELGLATDLVLRGSWALDAARQYERATQAIGAREDVLAVVAHDLRSSLGTIVMGNSVLAVSPTMSPADKLVVARIARAAEAMERLVRDLLDWASIEARRLAVTIAPLAVETILADVTEHLLPLATARELRLEIVGLAEGIEVRCDRARTAQVFSNLVGNAIKFTPKQGVITVSAELEAAYVRFVVEDHGPGIAEEHLPHVFERYWQAEPGTERRRGVGLGLAIASGIVAAQGGTIGVTSKLGSGSRFYFTVPRA